MVPKILDLPPEPTIHSMLVLCPKPYNADATPITITNLNRLIQSDSFLKTEVRIIK